MTASGKYLERERYDSIFTRTNAEFDANALSHDISTPGFLRCTAAPTWAGSWHATVRLCKLTHRSGACRPGRTEPPEPSISRAGDPATKEGQQNRFGQQNHSVQSRRQNTDPNTQFCEFCLVLTWLSWRLELQLACTTNIGFITATKMSWRCKISSWISHWYFDMSMNIISFLCCLSWSWIQFSEPFGLFYLSKLSSECRYLLPTN